MPVLPRMACARGGGPDRRTAELCPGNTRNRSGQGRWHRPDLLPRRCDARITGQSHNRPATTHQHIAHSRAWPARAVAVPTVGQQHFIRATSETDQGKGDGTDLTCYQGAVERASPASRITGPLRPASISRIAAHGLRARWRSRPSDSRALSHKPEKDQNKALAPPNPQRTKPRFACARGGDPDGRATELYLTTSEKDQNKALTPPNRQRLGARRRCAAGLRPSNPRGGVARMIAKDQNTNLIHILRSKLEEPTGTVQHAR